MAAKQNQGVTVLKPLAGGKSFGSTREARPETVGFERSPEKIRPPHSVTREVSQVVSHLLAFVAGALFCLAITGALLPILSDIYGRGVAIGVAKQGDGE